MQPTIKKIELQFQGDDIQVLYRAEDSDAADRGEKVFMEVFQSARDFVATFELPKDGAALGEVLRTGKFCQLKESFGGIHCTEFPLTERVYQAHDGMFGALAQPGEWESAQLPEDWPDDSFDNIEEDSHLLAAGGMAAAGPTMVKATAYFADGSNEAWRPDPPVSAIKLGNHWVELLGYVQ